MPWYKSGTVSVTLNSSAVIGTGTAFIANSRVGDAFRGPDGGWYEVINIASDTAMSISPNYKGATTAAGAYALAPMQGYVKDSADALRAIVNTYGAKLAALGTTGNYDILPANKGGTGLTAIGTAIAADVVTSATDMTADRLLTPGSGGLLGQAVPLTGHMNDALLGVLCQWNGTESESVSKGFPALGGVAATARYWNIFSYGAPTRMTQIITEVFAQGVARGRTFKRIKHETWWGWVEDVQAGANSNITSLSGLTTPLSLTQGGTGKTSIGGAAVGTVSQSGGVPTGAIIERGSNANGEYVKFADGTMISWWTRTGASISYGNVFTLAGGNTFYGAASWTFPVQFTGTPTVTCMARSTGRLVWTCLNTVNAATANFYILSALNETVSSDLTQVATGRWF